VVDDEVGDGHVVVVPVPAGAALVAILVAAQTDDNGGVGICETRQDRIKYRRPLTVWSVSTSLMSGEWRLVWMR
jgi:hypothetical protein